MKNPPIDIEKTIKVAVEAGRLSASRTAKDAYKATERRLYAIPVLRRKLEDDKERLEEIKAHGPRHKSSSVSRFVRSGARLTPDEILEAVIMDAEATIAADEYELEVMENALDFISEDDYYLTVTGRYIEELTDEEIAARIPCDSSTVWRNRKRLVQRVAIMLYGAAAVK